MTGHWTNRTGVWHTINGRSMLRENEVTLGQLLQDNGYVTGMFGKWHLGDNIGATRSLLEDLGIADNTLFIFTTDNGTASGEEVFNAGMRGKKGSEYDGGHRVPFIAHWPAAGWNRRHSSNMLCHAVDVVPTLVAMAGGTKPAELKWDGRSIRPLLDPAVDPDWADRMLVTDSQRVRDPVKWKQTAVMSQRWRLVNGRELYDMDADPGQQRNLAADHPDQVAAMAAFYDVWWAELEPTFSHTAEIPLSITSPPGRSG